MHAFLATSGDARTLLVNHDGQTEVMSHPLKPRLSTTCASFPPTKQLDKRIGAAWAFIECVHVKYINWPTS